LPRFVASDGCRDAGGEESSVTWVLDPPPCLAIGHEGNDEDRRHH